MNTHSMRKSVMLVTALAFVSLGVVMVFADEPGPTYFPSPRYHKPSPSPTDSPSPSVSPTASPTVSPVRNPSGSPSPSPSPVIGIYKPTPPWTWICIAILVLLLLFLLFWILRRRRKPTSYPPQPGRPGGDSYTPVDQQRPDQYKS